MNSSVDTTWVKVIQAEHIPPREGRTVLFDGASIAVFNTGEKFVALDNRCPHKGGPLSDGILSGTATGGSSVSPTVTCPLHNWRVNLETGQVTKPCDSGMHPVRSYPVKVEDGVLLIGVQVAAVAA